jgi:hypothetical protein
MYTSITETIPGEQFLINCLQKNISFSISDKVIKKGKLLLFRKIHYYIQIALQTEKNQKENFEIPIPFAIESYEDEGLMYMDYRMASLNVSNIPPIPSKVSSSYFNKILEISVI